MDGTGNRLLTDVSALDRGDDGTVWLHVEPPTGALLRGPCRGPEDAQPAATALERVAQRRRALDRGEPGDVGTRTGVPTPHAPTTADCGDEPHEWVSGHARSFPFPRIFADFLGNWT